MEFYLLCIFMFCLNQKCSRVMFKLISYLLVRGAKFISAILNYVMYIKIDINVIGRFSFVSGQLFLSMLGRHELLSVLQKFLGIFITFVRITHPCLVVYMSQCKVLFAGYKKMHIVVICLLVKTIWHLLMSSGKICRKM